MNYPLFTPNKSNWRVLQPTSTFSSLEHTKETCDLYLTVEYVKNSKGESRRYYRLNANKPHTIEMALAYEIKCPKCGKLMKQVGRCRDYHELGLYTCLDCDK